MRPAIKTLFLAVTLLFTLSASLLAQASDSVVVEKPSAVAMVGDLAIVRPVMLGLSILGTATYVVSLPFTLMGGNAGEAGNTLVVQPLKNTFVRCLGCVKAGYKKQVTSVEGSK